MKNDIPEYCDFDCPAAGFPPADTAGICRTMSAVWCGKLKELVNKNTPCVWRKRRQPTQKSAPASRPGEKKPSRTSRRQKHGSGNAPARRSRRRV